MLLGTIFQSIEAWRKLSAVNMKAAVAYKILKYTRLVQAEHEIAETQRVALIRDVTGTTVGEDAKIEPNSPEFVEYATKLNVVMSQESDLPKMDMDLDAIVDALDGKDDVLSVSDLAMLEPFFDTDIDTPAPSCCDRCDVAKA